MKPFTHTLATRTSLTSLFCDATLPLTTTQPSIFHFTPFSRLCHLSPICCILQGRPVKFYWSHCPCHMHILLQFKCPTSNAEARVTLFLQFRTNYYSHIARSALVYSRVPLQCVFSSALARFVLSDDCFLCLPCLCICLYVCTHVYHPCTYTMSYDFTSWFETVVQRLK